MAHYDLELGEVPGHRVDIPGVAMLGVGPVHQGRHARTDHDGNVEFTALGIDRIIFCVVGRNLGEERVDGRATETMGFDHKPQLVDGVHSLVRVKPGHADETVGILFEEGDNPLVAGSDAVGGFRVAAGDDALDHVLRFHVAHDVFNGLGAGALMEFEQRVHLAEDGMVDHPLYGGRDVRTETKVDDLHDGPLCMNVWRDALTTIFAFPKARGGPFVKQKTFNKTPYCYETDKIT